MRTYIDSAADLAAAHSVQDSIGLDGPSVPVGDVTVFGHPMKEEAGKVFRSMAALIAVNPKPTEDSGIKKQLALLGLGSPAGATDEALLNAGRSRAVDLLRNRGGTTDGGWSYPKANLGDFGADYLFRAQVAIGGLGALPTSEAIYMRAMPASGQPFFKGDAKYQLHFSAGQLPPVKAFWSLSLYEPDGTGAFYFYNNPEKVYAIKSGLDLKHKEDGSTEIIIAHTKPDDADVNWLPAPVSSFTLTFRAYLPAPDLLNRHYKLPRVEAI